MGNVEFENGYYHIFNRGVEKRDIYLCDEDYERFLASMSVFNNNLLHEERVYLRNRNVFPESNSEASELDSGKGSPLVEILAYCLNPNHFHLILKQLVGKGVEKFMHKLGTGYTNYFNQKYKRVGPLFQGKYKNKCISGDENLPWLSVYVNCNAQVHGIVQDAANYKWCSYPEYLGWRGDLLCKKDAILSQFESLDDYKQFADKAILEIRDKKKYEKYLME